VTWIVGIIAGMRPSRPNRLLARSMAQAALLIASTILVTGCTAAGNFVADRWPHWANGEPPDAPPRPGTPEYEEFRKQLIARGVKPLPSDDKMAAKDQSTPK
jgi:hypothetical protein